MAPTTTEIMQFDVFIGVFHLGSQASLVWENTKGSKSEL